MMMTALSRGNGRLHAFLALIANMARPAGRQKPVGDLRDVPDSLKRDIGLLDASEEGRGGAAPIGDETRRAAEERDRNWQRHLDRSMFPPV